jgi:CRISPR-associated protein (TIGR03985 family)
VDNTERHPTFEPITYKQLPSLIAKEVSGPQERQQLLQILNKRSPEDAYYRAWIRTGDINVIMRLRDWRPNGEVIAPLSIRQRLTAEATQELKNYQTY